MGIRIWENGDYHELTPEEIGKRKLEAEKDEQLYWSTISYKQAVINQIRLKYDHDDENAILRQRDTKPKEFEEYYAYCEQSKAYVKYKMGMEE